MFGMTVTLMAVLMLARPLPTECDRTVAVLVTGTVGHLAFLTGTEPGQELVLRGLLRLGAVGLAMVTGVELLLLVVVVVVAGTVNTALFTALAARPSNLSRH